ncbi:MAG: hypothetical protein J7J98_07610 [candidate division Zixibacteria bacterium]|nr:hypothetical protein [candidate division Zixibacteria bacterium]
MNTEKAKLIVKEIIKELSSRKGFDLHGLDDDILDEIKESWTEIIMKHTASW